MKEFFRLEQVNIYSKYLIFMAIQINLLLWGSECWALCKDLLLRLERFVNRKVRNIRNLNMWHVKDQRITIEELRKR